ncbi:beta-ketoacyl synthase N-terminal-like domain-containing protein, partial [Burkholderia ubonensis]
MSTPIAITGFGVLSPAGATPDALWRALETRAVLNGPWPKRPLAGYPADNVIAVPEAVWRTLEPGATGIENRAAALARHAIGQALADARLAGAGAGGLRIGCMLGTTTAGVEVAENVLVD